MAGVIKREQFKSGKAFSFANFEEHGRQILEAARQQAEQIVHGAHQRAEDEVAAARRKAYDKGLEEGRSAGLEQIQQEAKQKLWAETRAELESAQNTLAKSLAEFDSQKRRLIAQAERGLIDLALAIARRVCKAVGEASPAAAIANARRMLETVGREADLELHVSPEQHAALEKWAEEFVRQSESLAHVDVVADPAVPPGGCIVRGRHVKIDARIETQLDRIAAELGAASAVTDDGATP